MSTSVTVAPGQRSASRAQPPSPPPMISTRGAPAPGFPRGERHVDHHLVVMTLVHLRDLQVAVDGHHVAERLRVEDLDGLERATCAEMRSTSDVANAPKFRFPHSVERVASSRAPRSRTKCEPTFWSQLTQHGLWGSVRQPATAGRARVGQRKRLGLWLIIISCRFSRFSRRRRARRSARQPFCFGFGSLVARLFGGHPCRSGQPLLRARRQITMPQRQ